MEAVINRALTPPRPRASTARTTTPFLLAHIKDYTEGVSFASNLQLAYNNCPRGLPRIAIELAKLG